MATLQELEAKDMAERAKVQPKSRDIQEEEGSKMDNDEIVTNR